VNDEPYIGAVLRSLHRRELAAHRHRRTVSKEIGVNDEELLVLLYLAEHDGCTQGELAAFTGLSRSGLAAMVQRLEAAGYAERRPDPADKRVRLVHLTARSRGHIAQAFAELSRRVDRLFDGRPPDEIDRLERFLADVADLSEHHARQSAGDPDVALDRSARPIWQLWG
jgi:DNA-binding MarR family transcriptional regulator